MPWSHEAFPCSKAVNLKSALVLMGPCVLIQGSCVVSKCPNGAMSWESLEGVPCVGGIPYSNRPHLTATPANPNLV